MHSRRDFIRDVARLSASAGIVGAFPDSISKAMAIEPEKGSTVLDAEHVVILMQENRSFDHAFGTLRGVRGFDDPRAISLPDGNPVWVQANAAGQRYAPFHLDIKDTRSTWMGCLPHGWTDQVDARNGGRYDRWLDVKKSGTRQFARMPLTLGYYIRADIPFYYALADAFTICDQHFCSSLTGTTPNRLYLWTGTIRAQQTPDSPALVINEDADLNTLVTWTTFPERLEAEGISWKIYQNDLTIDSGLSQEEDAWLANFGDNPIEYFTQYHVNFAATHRAYIERRVKELPGEIEALKKQLAAFTGPAGSKSRLEKQLADLVAKLKRYSAEIEQLTKHNLDTLSPREKGIHARAFSTNTGDPFYREMTEIAYQDEDVRRKVRVPKGDIFHQFRKDVNEGKLPTVSWMVAPQEFSDHPSSAWYGSWYISEIMNILTHNPAVWKKTVFILTYDENDGYFDHVPPFVAPHPRRPETGRVSKGIDAAVEFVELEQDKKRRPVADARESSIGLGYRVPMIIASPWSRGGCVCSQVFDHTSPLQFLEKLLSHKTGRKIEEPNISRWRRAVCGDLMASFQASPEDNEAKLPFQERDPFISEIHAAKFKKLPGDFRPLTTDEINQIRRDPRASSRLPHQEPGLRRSCALPYQLQVNGSLMPDRKRLGLRLEASKEVFGARAAGSPFVVYAFQGPDKVTVRNYAVEPGDRLEDSWALDEFEGGRYHLRVYGPNGFFREFQGSADDPPLSLEIQFSRASGNLRELTGGIDIVAINQDSRQKYLLQFRDNSYSNDVFEKEIPAAGRLSTTIETKRSHGWYDFTVAVSNSKHIQRYAGRVENGKWGFSDPAIGKARA